MNAINEFKFRAALARRIERRGTPGDIAAWRVENFCRFLDGRPRVSLARFNEANPADASLADTPAARAGDLDTSQERAMCVRKAVVR